MAVFDWSTDPNANANMPGISIPEGCNPGNLNDAIRQIMADVREAFSRPAVEGNSGDTSQWLIVSDGTVFMSGDLQMSSHNVRDIPFPAAFTDNNAVPASWVDATYQRKSDLINRLAPVGAGPVIITMFNVNPGTYLGGTWTNVGQGRIPIGVGVGTDTNAFARSFSQGEQSGEYNHQLTITEMPAHTHPTDVSSGGTTGGFDFGRHDPAGPRTSGSTGGNAPHNNVQPYFAVYFWQRVG